MSTSCASLAPASWTAKAGVRVGFGLGMRIRILVLLLALLTYAEGAILQAAAREGLDGVRQPGHVDLLDMHRLGSTGAAAAARREWRVHRGGGEGMELALTLTQTQTLTLTLTQALTLTLASWVRCEVHLQRTRCMPKRRMS